MHHPKRLAPGAELAHLAYPRRRQPLRAPLLLNPFHQRSVLRSHPLATLRCDGAGGLLPRYASGWSEHGCADHQTDHQTGGVPRKQWRKYPLGRRFTRVVDPGVDYGCPPARLARRSSSARRISPFRERCCSRASRRNESSMPVGDRTVSGSVLCVLSVRVQPLQLHPGLESRYVVQITR